MNTKLKTIKRRLKPLILSLPEMIDRSWLLSAYLSIRKAYSLNYHNDSFSKLSKADQDDILLYINSLSSLKTMTRHREWIAGYYFNNAMFRIVALAETGLKVLYTRETKKKAPEDNYAYNNLLLPWYEGRYGILHNLKNARKQVNKFKHRNRDRMRPKTSRLLEKLLTLLMNYFHYWKKYNGV